MVPRNLLRKLGALTRAEWLELCRAQLALIAAQLAVWTRPQGELVSRSDRTLSGTGRVGADARAVRLGVAVHRAASYGVFRPRCLVRALALVRLLDAAGIQGGRLRIGVRRDGSRLLAHAWVEHGSLVLADRREHVRGFHELADVDVLPGS